MIERAYPLLKESLLLLGPRGVGKSTFVRTQLKPDLELDLLHSQTKRALMLNPSLLEEHVAHLKKGDVVFIDEIQKIPELLDEVHRLIEKLKLKFILTGSSARKLRRAGTNLLAGRALGLKMFPLSLHEIKDYKIDRLLKYGTLPTVLVGTVSSEEYLNSYVDHYLKEEIFQEGLTRNLSEFTEFTSIAGQYHGQILNYESIARELKKSGDTVKSWFQILEDTLVGARIEPYKANVFSRENRHPKFYFFDSGVAWASTGQDFSEIPTEFKGYQFESLILNEIRTYLECHRKRFQIYFLSVPQVGDIDFIVQIAKKSLSKPEKVVSIEVKANKEWKNGYEKMSLELKSKAASKVHKSFAVYLGSRRLTKKDLHIFPLNDFVKSLWNGEIL